MPIRLFLFLFLVESFLYPCMTSAYYTGMDANVVVGQTNFTSNSEYMGGSASNNNFSYAYGVTSYSGRLIVSDLSAHRILIFNKIPETNGVSADVVIGQQNFTSVSANQGGSAGANTLKQPWYSTVTNTGKLIVPDYGNNRVLIYNSIPTSNNASADVVIGQQNFTSVSANQGGSAGANTLRGPTSVFYDQDSGKLFITDLSNNRVLIYNSIPTSNNASADMVIGQTNFTNAARDQGGAPTASTLDNPNNATVVNGKVIITDSNNNRVLIYNSIPTSNNASADVVIGQQNFTVSSTNQGSTVGPNTFWYPVQTTWDGKRLFIVDESNSRVLIFNGIPTSNNASADVVIGQQNFTASSTNQGSTVGPNTLSYPESIGVIADNKLAVFDAYNYRLLIYHNITASPLVSLGDVTSLSSGKLKVTGNVVLGERDRYILKSVEMGVNGEGLTNVSSLGSGVLDGVGKTRYEFYNEFEPWKGNNGTIEEWRDSGKATATYGYTLLTRALSLQGDDSKSFYFAPFELYKPKVENGRLSFEFKVNKKLKRVLNEHLASFELWRSVGGKEEKVSPSIPIDFTLVKDRAENMRRAEYVGKSGSNGVYEDKAMTVSYSEDSSFISVKLKNSVLSGKYSYYLKAIDKYGNSQKSNTQEVVTSSLTNTTPTGVWFPLQINRASNTNISMLSSFVTPRTRSFRYTSNYTTFEGVGMSGDTIKVTVSPLSNQTQREKTYNTTVTPNSRWLLRVPIESSSQVLIEETKDSLYASVGVVTLER